MRVKLLSLILSISFATVLVSAILLFNLHRQQLIHNAQFGATALGESIEAGLHHAMVMNDWTMIHDIMNAVVDAGIVTSLRILNTEGRVSVSSSSTEIGQSFSLTDPQCRLCHATEQPPNNKVMLTDAEDGRDVLMHVTPLQNKPECQSCHAPEQAVLGLLMIERLLMVNSGSNQAIFWQMLFLIVASLSVLIGLILPILNRFVIKPIDELSKGVKEISAGNLNYRVPVINHDQLGELAISFNKMQQELKSSITKMQQKEKELAILNEVASTTTRLTDLQESMESALNTIVDELGLAAGLIYLYNESTSEYNLRASRGASAEVIEKIEDWRKDIWEKQAKDHLLREQFYHADMTAAGCIDDLCEEKDYCEYFELPLITKASVFGILVLVKSSGQALVEEELDYFKVLSMEISIAIDHAILLADTRRREDEAHNLYELSTKISASLALQDVLRGAAESAKELLDGDLSLLGLFDEKCQDFVVEAVSGQQANPLIGTRLPLDENKAGAQLTKGRPVTSLSNDIFQPGFHHLETVEENSFQSFITVPLLLGSRFLGILQVMRHEPRRFLPRETQLLMELAQHIVVSIENAQLYRQLHTLAILEERDRLAREMHDHLAQALGYLNVKASITHDLLSSDSLEKAKESLDEFKRVANLLYTDVRESIFNLRTSVTPSMEFLPALLDYLEEYHTHYGLDARLMLGNDYPIVLNSEVSIQIMRIIQEALTNVRRHAAASQVRIWLKDDGEQVVIIIEDDGMGFSTQDLFAQDQQQHYGLQIMQERAENVGGELSLESNPGKGTRVILKVPLKG
jgi:nitrate/nitrite-specific signal transduction histidine kinase